MIKKNYKTSEECEAELKRFQDDVFDTRKIQIRKIDGWPWRRGFRPLHIEKLKELIEEYSQREVAKMFKVTQRTIGRAMERQGIKSPRTVGRKPSGIWI